MDCSINELEKIIPSKEIDDKPKKTYEIEEAPFVDNSLIYIQTFFNQNFKKFFMILNHNNKFKGLYALGFYYAKSRYPKKYESDRLTNYIIGLKRWQKYLRKKFNMGRKIAEDYLSYIEKSEILRRIIDKIDYIFMIPSKKSINHVSFWGKILCERLQKTNLSEELILKKILKYYKRSDAYSRLEKVKDAFKLDSSCLRYHSLKSKICLILDDICTTGNQINAVSELLSKNGAKEIYAFVLGITKPIG